jgi:hypothetical protein
LSCADAGAEQRPTKFRAASSFFTGILFTVKEAVDALLTPEKEVGDVEAKWVFWKNQN